MVWMGDLGKIRVHALVDSLSAGGAELLLAEFASVAPSVGIDFTVGYLQARNGNPGVERLVAAGVDPVFVGIPERLYYPSSVMTVRRHLAGIGPDVVHTHLIASDVLGGFASRSLKLPVLSTRHSITSRVSLRDSPRISARNALWSFATRTCMDVIIGVSDAARMSYLDFSGDRPKRVITVHNGVSSSPRPGAGRAVRAELGLEDRHLVISMISGLRHPKAHHVALDAVAELRHRFPDLRLVIVGDGDLRGELEQAAAPLGEHVRFTGYRNDAMAVLDASDVLIQPSLWEALPTTVLEAMSAGVPVVATDVGGTPEIIEGGTSGILIAAPPRAADLTRALTRLLADPDLRSRLADGGHKRFESSFSAQQWGKRLREVYEGVARNGANRG